MLTDTINKAVTIARVAGLGFALWREIRTIAHEMALIAAEEDEEEMRAHMDALDELDPNTLQGVAWQMIKVWANDPANDWLEHM